MTAPHCLDCLVIGGGRLAGGFVVPLLRDAGWAVTLACRTGEIRAAIDAHRGVWLRIGDAPRRGRWIDGVGAISLDPAELTHAVARTSLIATAVGPSALPDVGRTLAPALRQRLDTARIPINIVTFENHRRAAEQLAGGLIDADPALAPEIGRRIGIGGAAVWRTVSRRQPTDAGLLFAANAERTCYMDGLSLLQGVPPVDGSLPGIELVRAFDDRMVEKLWVFNAGHCAAAYLGWHAGCATLDEALGRPEIRSVVAVVVAEAQRGFTAYLASRPGSTPIAPRSPDAILDHYADPTLNDPVVRVAREPRRKLARDDRLIGPSLACLAAGIAPVALATAVAAALAYAETSDAQAGSIQQELTFLEPEEVLATLSQLDPSDELVQLVCQRYRNRAWAAAEVLP